MKIGNFTFMLMLFVLLTLAYAAGREHGQAEAQAKAEFRRNLEPLLAECISMADKATEERSIALHMANNCCGENITIYSTNFSTEE